MQADVLVVGAGPSGIATAIAASLKGLRATVIDCRKPPIDKPCGEGLLPEAVAALRAIGIELNSSAGFPFSGIRFADEHSSAGAKFPRGQAFGLRRVTLHKLLIERAVEAGVSFLWGARISRFEPESVCADGKSISYKWLIGADGQNSIVRKWARLGRGRPIHSRFGFRRHYFVSPWTDRVEVFWGDRCQMIVTPTDPDQICVVLLSSDPRLRIDTALVQFPEVARHLGAARPASSEQGAVTSLRRGRIITRGRVALVGDASCTVDGIAGQGLNLGLQQAACLADALSRGDLGQYESAHRDLTKTAIRMTRLLLLMDKSATIRRKALRLFARKPALFAKMISIHAGEPAQASLQFRKLFGLGWDVLWA